MAKRNAEDAGFNNPQNEENSEEHEESEGDVDMDKDENEESNYDYSSDDSDVPLDAEYMRGFALSWLEDKRVDGLTPQAIFDSLGMKVVCKLTCLFALVCSSNNIYHQVMDDIDVTEQWELLERVVTSEGIAHSIFRTLFTPHRHKLPTINTFEDVVELIKTANNIVVLTGAGVSVSCGIPDFRSPGGMYPSHKRGKKTKENIRKR